MKFPRSDSPQCRFASASNHHIASMLRKLFVDFFGRLREQSLEAVYEFIRSRRNADTVTISWQQSFTLVPGQQLQTVVSEGLRTFNANIA